MARGLGDWSQLAALSTMLDPWAPGFGPFCVVLQVLGSVAVDLEYVSTALETLVNLPWSLVFLHWVCDWCFVSLTSCVAKPWFPCCRYSGTMVNWILGLCSARTSALMGSSSMAWHVVLATGLWCVSLCVVWLTS
jgi:hypothetical protein